MGDNKLGGKVHGEPLTFFTIQGLSYVTWHQFKRVPILGNKKHNTYSVLVDGTGSNCLFLTKHCVTKLIVMEKECFRTMTF